MGNEAKWGYFRVMYERYHKAERKARAALLDEFCVNTGYNRKYAIRLLNGPRPEKERVRRPREQPNALYRFGACSTMRWQCSVPHCVRRQLVR